MKTLIYSVSALILTFLLSSCEKELDIKYHDIEPLTVIEGELTPDGVRVTLTQTTPMDEPMDRTHLTDADVVLSDLTTGEEYLLTVGNDGVYTSAAGGIVGHDYRLGDKGCGILQCDDTYVCWYRNHGACLFMDCDAL